MTPTNLGPPGGPPSRYRREEWLDVRPYWVPPEAGGRLLIDGPAVLVAVLSAAIDTTGAFITTIYDGTDANGRVVWKSGRGSFGDPWWARLASGLYVDVPNSATGMMVVAAPLSAEAAREAARFK